MADHREHAELSGEPSETAIARTLAALGSYGDRLALTVDDPVEPGQTWAYGELLAQVYREARRLTELGVGRGSVVAVLTGDTAETFVLRWAVNTVGAAVTVWADGFAAPVIAELLETSQAQLMVTNKARYALGAAAAQLVAGEVTVVDLDASPPPADPSPVELQSRPGDLTSIALTGGSTGTPKAVPRYGPRIPAPASPPSSSPWQGAVQLLCTPVAHVGGSLVAQGVFSAGGRVVLQPGFDPARALAAIPREQVTTISLMPRLLHQLLDHPDLPGTDTSSLRSIVLGSAPASPARIGEAIDRFGPIVAQGYGSTEAANISWISAAELARPELRGSVGRPGGEVALSIHDDEGAEVTTGDTGEVWVRTPMMSGYLNAPAATAALFCDGWLRTGDLGYLDQDGYLWLVGRGSEVIFAEHARIYPTDVENCLLGHPAVAAAAVFAQHDADRAETAAAAVVPHEGSCPEPAELIAWVTERRGPHLAPHTVYLADDLPLTHSAKVDREAVRVRFASG